MVQEEAMARTETVAAPPPPAEHAQLSPQANQVTQPVQKTDGGPSDLKHARQMAREIGKRFFETEEYDIPTFLRRPND